MKKVPRMIVAFDTRGEWGRSFLRGIANFAERYGPWDCDFTFVGPLASQDVQRINNADGLIAHVNTPKSSALVKRIKVPIVTVELGAPSHLPNVHCDPVGIGKIAAKHFIERGFRRFGFCAFSGTPSARARGKAFVEAVETAGYSCDLFNLIPEGSPSWKPEHAQLASWIKKLPKPVAIFCAGDARARSIATVCRDWGFPVPAQVAILGVDNDELLCRLCSPQLSSIDAGAQTVGFEAARLLQRAIHGHPTPPPVAVPPMRVIVRESSDVFAVEDPHVVTAMRFIRDHVPDGVNVKQLMQHLPVSRRKLELAFRKHLGRTLHEEILLAKFHRAVRLLVDEHLSLSQIAEQCGMTHPSRLNHLIREQTGMTPMQYRRKHQKKVL